ncbi:hypothetical protein BCV70DRAFT_199329 [Testicularia cyperi]|uniref:Cation/H+ exchanger transmembrane domain-containing protein n=1 Tax=Testicularia cyperi TaxID=1882483 RepID=A0A317XRH9_9BASI|nr:hypothetical protein BCV70DRAFT_199329 [Testicularia cyperi]
MVRPLHAIAAIASSGGSTVQNDDALPYTSPTIVTILVISSYLLFLSLFYHVFQRIFSAGILGPLILGAIYAKPLANILPADVQSAILTIGYLGLMLLIVQGGIEARLDILSNPKNLLMATLVGFTGIGLPIGLSMALLPPGFGFGQLESFTVGAALSSTSLGTTFAVLSTFSSPSVAKDSSKDGSGQRNGRDTLSETRNNSPPADSEAVTGNGGITDTRIGTILVGAALLDDIVGLVITGVISTLGSTAGSSQGSVSVAPWTIARPIVSSFLLIVVTSLLARFVLRPTATRLLFPALVRVSSSLDRSRGSSIGENTGIATTLLGKLCHNAGTLRYVSIFLLSFTVLAYSVISEEIGSSLLIGCFCAGGIMEYLYSHWASYRVRMRGTQPQVSKILDPNHTLSYTTLAVIQETILVPFFFSSIGSAIPVKSMFDGKTVWRGIIFSGLMAFAKVAAGAWIYLGDWVEQKASNRLAGTEQAAHTGRSQYTESSDVNEVAQTLEMGAMRPDSRPASEAHVHDEEGAVTETVVAAADRIEQSEMTMVNDSQRQRPESLKKNDDAQNEAALWPPVLFLGLALMSRGEIGFLIINIARQGGLVSETAFNVAIWAITLNTLAGPMSIGTLMKTEHGRSILTNRASRWS